VGKGAIGLLPDDLKAFLRGGFSQLTRIGDDKQDELFALALEAAGHPRYGLNPIGVGKDFGLSENEVRTIMGAFTVIVETLVTTTDLSVDQFLTDLREASLTDQSSEATIRRLAGRLVADRETYRRRFEENRLANRTLPSLEGFSCSIDLRIGFKDLVPTISAPVAIVRLRTDVGDGQLNFQMTPRQVSQLIGDLEQVSKRLKEAATVAARGLKQG
jgi:hypothetical protein